MPDKRNGNRKDQVRLTNSLERRIKDYSLAAVGIGAVAFSPAASAAIVVTSPGTMIPFQHHGPFIPISIGGNAAAIAFNNLSTDTGSCTVSARPSASGYLLGPQGRIPGQQISPVAMSQSIPGMLHHFPAGRHVQLATSSTSGKHKFLAFVGTNYIGFAFHIGGQLHYGWVKLSITQTGVLSMGGVTSFVVTILQTGYETIPGQLIEAGQTSDSSPPATPAPNSLWLMALGAAGIAGLELLRRRRTA
jgi:MYXO-CTERM domain-containing protein